MPLQQRSFFQGLYSKVKAMFSNVNHRFPFQSVKNKLNWRNISLRNQCANTANLRNCSGFNQSMQRKLKCKHLIPKQFQKKKERQFLVSARTSTVFPRKKKLQRCRFLKRRLTPYELVFMCTCIGYRDANGGFFFLFRSQAAVFYLRSLASTLKEKETWQSIWTFWGTPSRILR